MKYLTTAFNHLRSAICSPYSYFFDMSMGRAAGLAGFLLSLTLFGDIHISSNPAIYSSIFALPLTALILTISESIKHRFASKHQKSRAEDEKDISQFKDKVEKYLNEYKSALKTEQDMDNVLRDDEHTSTHVKVKSVLKNLYPKPLESNNDFIDAAWRVFDIDSLNTKETILRQVTDTINLTTSIASGASTGFIFYTMAALLKEQTHDKTIRGIAFSSAIIYALFAAALSLDSSEKYWKAIKQQKENSKQLLNAVCQMLTDTTPLPVELKPVLDEWHKRNPSPEIESSATFRH